MYIFQQKRMFIRIIGLLTITNIILIIILFRFSLHSKTPLLFPKNEDYKDVTGILKKELELNDNQVVKMNEIRELYYEKEIALKQFIKNDKDSMNVEMFAKNTNETKVLFLAKRVADNEYKMELLRFEQSKDLKNICTVPQQQKFENLVLEIRDYFRPDNQPKKR